MKKVHLTLNHYECTAFAEMISYAISKDIKDKILHALLAELHIILQRKIMFYNNKHSITLSAAQALALHKATLDVLLFTTDNYSQCVLLDIFNKIDKSFA